MSERKVCQRMGHKWVVSVDGFLLPVYFCRRWFCDGSRMNPWFGRIYADQEREVGEAAQAPLQETYEVGVGVEAEDNE